MGELLALFSAFSFGLSTVMARKGSFSGSKENPSINGAFISMLLTFFISGTVCLFVHLYTGPLILNWRGIVLFLVAGLLNIYFGRTFLYLAIQHLGSLRTSTVKNLIPFFTIIIAVLFFGEPFTIVVIIGGAVIFIGLYIMIHSNGSFKKQTVSHETSVLDSKKTKQNSTLSSVIRVGYLFSLIAVISYAFGNSIRKVGLGFLPDPFLGSAMGSLVGIAVFMVISLLKKQMHTLIKDTLYNVNRYLYLSGLMMSLGQMAFFMSLEYIDISRSILIVSLETIFVIFFSLRLIKPDEGITVRTVTASLIVLSGVFLILIYP